MTLELTDNNKTRTNTSLWHSLNLVTCLYICTWSLVPLFRSTTNIGIFRYLIIVICGVWFVSSVLIGRRWIYDLIPISFIGSTYLILITLYVIFDYGDGTLMRLVAPLFLFFYAYMGRFYFLRGNKKTINIILFWIALCFIFTATSTLKVIFDNPEASRIVTNSSNSPEVDAYFESLNVAGYGFVYGILILIPALIGSLKSLSGALSKFLVSIVFALSIALVFLANYTIAIIMLLLALTLPFLHIKRRGVLMLPLLFVLLIILYPFLNELLISVLTFIGELSPSIRTAGRMDRLTDYLSRGSDFQSLTGRTALFGNSLRSFFSSPLIGVGAYYSSWPTIGNHAQFIDDLGRYGLLGALPFFVFMFRVLQKSYVSLGNIKNRTNFVDSCLLFCILGFLNPILTNNIVFSVFFVLPVLYKNIQISGSK